ncbi:AN1-like Zinc finger [Rhizoctonia solani]|uniref:AN1-like Zinc finger n=1 Tax=Rhizoctonia solani TaxID=456999 RepID=A0A8H7M6Y4_9AGAM|nr:AN1-like Zinc finger [Rhizoctonia solani]
MRHCRSPPRHSSVESAGRPLVTGLPHRWALRPIKAEQRRASLHHLPQLTRHLEHIKFAMATRKDSTDAQMLFVGSACSLANCTQHDFLPIKCNLCSATFCSDHFRPDEHKCTKYDPAKADRVAPSCPLCSTPVSIPLGQDPNLKMDAHIMNECTAMGNRGNNRQAKRCAGPRCAKVLIAPIRCDVQLSQGVLSEHRFPQQHTCAAGSTKPSPSPTPTPQPVMSKLSDKLSGVSIGGMRPGNVAPKPKPVPSSSEGAGSSKPAVHNPFNKTDRCDPTSHASADADVLPATKRPTAIDTSRAKAERGFSAERVARAQQEGLLSDAEKARLARLEAEAKQDGDCVLM